MRGWSRCSAVLVGALLGCDGAGGARVDAAGGDGSAGLNGGAAAGHAGSGSGAEGGAATASEPTSGAVSAPRGGTRLKVRIAEAESGAFQFLGWQDTELDVSCAFEQLPSGALLCVPNGEAMAWAMEETDPPLYADTNCSQPARELQFAERCGPSPQFTMGTSEDRCHTDPSYFRVGENLRFVYRKVGDECRVEPVPQRSNALSRGFFALTALAAEEEFVAGSLHDGPIADGIQPRYLTTADGAEAFWGFRDAVQGFDCQLAPMAAGVRCVPTDMPLVTGGNFADENCLQPAAIALGCSTRDVIDYALDASPHDGANDVWHIVEGGPRLMTSYVGTPGAGNCLEFETDEAVFAIGDEVVGSSFATGALEANTDGQGFVTTIQHAGGWSALDTQPVHNTDFGGYDCTFLPTSDGVTRCLPSPDFSPMRYADAACSEGVVEGWGTSPIVAFASEQCPRQVSVFSVGEEYSGPIYRKDAEQCVFSHEQPPQPSRTMAHRVGAELPADSFPEMPIVLR